MYHPTSVASPAGTIRASVLSGGQPLPLYRRADGRMFAAAVPGAAYTLLVISLTGRRTEVITTVDGRHVLRDEPGDAQACQGLVIAPGSTYEFRGWRVSDAGTDEFLFGDPSASVAQQATGSPANTGVIGFAAWREAAPVSVAVASPGLLTQGSKGLPGPASAELRDGGGSVGTGIGARQHDPVGHTSFSRGDGPDILVTGYDTGAELIRRGIIIPPSGPDAFPGEETGYGAFRHAR